MELVGQEKACQWKLVMAGSVRNAGDEKRVQMLQILSKELGISVSDLCHLHFASELTMLSLE